MADAWNALTAANFASYVGKYADYLVVFGAICLGHVAFRVGRTILRVSYRALRRSFAVDLKQYGRWAVVTGCTDGIGKSFALQLAEKGLDVVLISRNPEKLSAVAEQIAEQHKVSVKVITADFKNADIYDNIKHQLSGLDIGILVNNVGMLNRRNPGYFCEADNFEQFNQDILNVNVLSCVQMTGIVLPGMLERKRGTIINIGSGAAIRPLPFFSVYSGTKAFISYFTQALNMEYSSQGVMIQLVSPNMVVSNLSRDLAIVSGLSQGLFYPKAEEFVRKAIQTIGRETVTGAHWPHELQHYITPMVSESTMTAIMLRERNKLEEFLKKQ